MDYTTQPDLEANPVTSKISDPYESQCIQPSVLRLMDYSFLNLIVLNNYSPGTTKEV